MKLTKLALIVALSMGSTLTHAAVFSDNFNTYPTTQLDWAPQNGWYYLGAGDVDLIQNDGAYFPAVSNGDGKYIDLDGSVGGALVNLNHGISLIGGQQYALSFDLAGNQRDSVYQDTVVAHFDEALMTIGVTPNSIFQTYVLNYTPLTSGFYSFGFGDVNSFGNNNVGALLDNVLVTAVPEPETYALLLGGLALVGFSARRRKTEV